MKEETAKRQAEAYARATTNTRCARMGECQGCSIRYCDYKSRAEAFLQGYESAEAAQKGAHNEKDDRQQ